MRIAYLIRVYTDPLQLQRLIEALNGEHAYFFVHVQPNLTLFRKVDMSPFIAATSQEKNVRFIQQRIRVNWGGFSMVEATLALMREALDSEVSFDYFVLLSGLDYPIKSNAFILDYFDKHHGREFIRYISIREEPFLEWKINMIWFNEHVLVTRALHRARRLRVWSGIQSLLLKRNEYPDGFEPFFGPSWWALTRNCVKYVVHFVDTNRKFVDFYRFTHMPDESFFHTVIMNSEYAEKTNQRVEYENGEIDHPVKWAGDLIMYVKDFAKGRSVVLDEQDFESLGKSNCLFARKFTSAKSLKLIEPVDKYLLGRDAQARVLGSAS